MDYSSEFGGLIAFGESVWNLIAAGVGTWQFAPLSSFIPGSVGTAFRTVGWYIYTIIIRLRAAASAARRFVRAQRRAGASGRRAVLPEMESTFKSDLIGVDLDKPVAEEKPAELARSCRAAHLRVQLLRVDGRSSRRRSACGDGGRRMVCSSGRERIRRSADEALLGSLDAMGVETTLEAWHARMQVTQTDAPLGSRRDVRVRALQQLIEPAHQGRARARAPPSHRRRRGRRGGADDGAGLAGGVAPLRGARRRRRRRRGERSACARSCRATGPAKTTRGCMSA